jgi:hypothetical protein
MTRPLVGILDCTTNETIVREMNDEEYAQYEIDISVTPTEEI